MPDIVILLSRILMSAVFIVYGWMKFANVTGILNSEGTKRFMALVASGAPAPTWLGYLIAAIELLGGLAILIGVKTRWVAGAFVLWVIIVTALGHPFWTLEGAAHAPNMSNFYKNLAIMGAYLLLAVTGAGRYSFDHRSVAVAPKPAVAAA